MFAGSKGGGSSTAFKTTPDNLRSTDTFEAVLGLCAGPIKGPTRGLKSIKLDGTAIENETGQQNFLDFNATLGDGDPLKFPQKIQLKLGAGAAPTSVGLSLSNADGSNPVWVTKTLANTNADFIDLRFIVQQLFRQDSKGIYTETATLEIQMKPVGSSTWVNPTIGTPSGGYQETGIDYEGMDNSLLKLFIPRDYYNTAGTAYQPQSSNYVINGKTGSPAVYELRLAVPNTGAYANTAWDIRVRLLERETYTQDENEERRTIQWESMAAVYSSVLGEHEDWRGVAWLQMYGKASDQLTGVPETIGEYDTKIVKVPATIYNPDTRQYTGAIWDGSWSKAFTTDPAWIINDAISDELSGISLIAPGSFLNKWDALDLSKWCSQLVPDGDGGTQPRYSMNIAITTPQKGEEFIRYLAGAVGALAWDQGDGEWRIKADKNDAPVDLFTLDNIEGEFLYAHTDVDTRFNDIIGKFKSAEMDYREDGVQLFDNASIAQIGRKPTTIVLVGCTNRQEAMRRVKLRLRATVNENRIVTFTTNRRGRNVEPLSTILIADGDLGDQDQRTTGRAISIASDRLSIVVRDPMYVAPGVAYTMKFAVPNASYDPDTNTQPSDTDWTKPTLVATRNVTNTSGQRGNVTTIHLDTALPADVDLNVNVALEATNLATMPRLYRVTSVTVGDDGERISIAAINVDTGKQDAADNVSKEDTVFQDLRGAVPPPLPIPGHDFVSLVRVPIEQGSQVNLQANWMRPPGAFVSGFRVQYSVNGGALQTAVDRQQFVEWELPNAGPGTYRVEVCTMDRRGGYSLPLVGELEVTQSLIDSTQIKYVGGETLESLKPAEAGATNGMSASEAAELAAAIADIVDLASDSVITAPGEKARAKLDAVALLQQIQSAHDRWVALGSPSDSSAAVAAADTAGAALTTYLNTAVPDWADDSHDSTIVASVWKTKWTNAYTAAAYAQMAIAGRSALVGYLTNETHTLPADSSGAISSYAGADGNFKIFLGSTDVTASCTFAVTSNLQTLAGSQSGAYNLINSATGAYNVTSGFDAGESVAYVDFTATFTPTGQTITKRFSLSKSVAGAGGTGADAILISLASTSQQVKYDTANSFVAGQSITFVSTRQNSGATPTFRFLTLSGTDLGVLTAAAWASTYPTLFSTTGVDNLTVLAAELQVLIDTYGAFAVEASVGTIKDRVSVVKVRDGAVGATGAPGSDAFAGYLTNENHTVPADASGNVLSYAGASGNFKVFKGLVDVTGSCTFAVSTNPQVLAGSQSGAYNLINSATGAYDVTSGLDVGEASAVVDFVATYTPTGQTISKRLTIAKSKTGATGGNGADAKQILVTSTHQTFKYNAAGAVQTQTTTFTATRQNTSVATEWQVKLLDGTTMVGWSPASVFVGTGYWTSSSNDNLTMTHTQWAALMAAWGGAQGLIMEGRIVDGVTISDRISVVNVGDGANGASAYQFDINVNVIDVQLLNTGVIKGGQLPRYITPTVKYGPTDVTASCTFTFAYSDGTMLAASYSSPLIAVDTANAAGWIDVTARISGVAVGAVKRIVVTRTADPTPPATQNSGTKSETIVVQTSDTTYGVENSSNLTVAANPSGVINFIYSYEYSGQSLSAPVNPDRTLTVGGKVQYRVAGSGGAYSDAISEVVGSRCLLPGQVTGSMDEQGLLSMSGAISGLTAGTSYEVRAIFRRTASSGTNIQAAGPLSEYVSQ